MCYLPNYVPPLRILFFLNGKTGDFLLAEFFSSSSSYLLCFFFKLFPICFWESLNKDYWPGHYWPPPRNWTVRDKARRVHILLRQVSLFWGEEAEAVQEGSGQEGTRAKGGVWEVGQEDMGGDEGQAKGSEAPGPVWGHHWHSGQPLPWNIYGHTAAAGCHWLRPG